MGVGRRVYAVSVPFAFLVALADLGDVAVWSKGKLASKGGCTHPAHPIPLASLTFVGVGVFVVVGAVVLVVVSWDMGGDVAVIPLPGVGG
jgi:hypothetical protein